MNKFFKRLALLLAVLMIVSMMPVQLFADNSVITYVNNGTENGEDGTTTTEVASYVTVELEFGLNVSAEDIVAAKALYEGKKFDTCKAANEAYMALFGVTWGKGYLGERAILMLQTIALPSTSMQVFRARLQKLSTTSTVHLQALLRSSLIGTILIALLAETIRLPAQASALSVLMTKMAARQS